MAYFIKKNSLIFLKNNSIPPQSEQGKLGNYFLIYLRLLSNIRKSHSFIKNDLIFFRKYYCQDKRRVNTNLLSFFSFIFLFFLYKI